MAIKSSNQITITDITDAYSVILSSESFTIAGGTSGATSGSCKTNVMAMRGGAALTPSSIGTITFAKADGTSSDVLTANIGTLGTSTEIEFSIVSGKTLSETIEATIPVKLENDTITVNKKFSFSVAKTGSQGQQGPAGSAGAKWYQGSGAPSSGTGSNGDYYLNTTNGDVYTKSSGTWTQTGNIKGATGSTGPAGSNGAKWFEGSGAPTSSSPSGAVEGDYYLNTSNGDVYVKGSSGWGSSVGNIKGATGATGADGADAILIAIESDNGVTFKNSTGNTTLTPAVYVGGSAATIGTTGTTGKFSVSFGGSTIGYLYWYCGSTKLDSTNTGSASSKKGEFVSGTPNGRLKVYAAQVSNSQPYSCKLEDA